MAILPALSLFVCLTLADSPALAEQSLFKDMGNRYCKTYDRSTMKRVQGVQSDAACQAKCVTTATMKSSTCNAIAYSASSKECVLYQECVMSKERQSWGYNYWKVTLPEGAHSLFRDMGNRYCETYNHEKMQRVQGVQSAAACQAKCVTTATMKSSTCNAVAYSASSKECILYRGCVISEKTQSWGLNYWKVTLPEGVDNNPRAGKYCYYMTHTPGETVGQSMPKAAARPAKVGTGSLFDRCIQGMDGYISNSLSGDIRYIQWTMESGNAQMCYYYQGGSSKGKSGHYTWRFDRANCRDHHWPLNSSEYAAGHNCGPDAVRLGRGAMKGAEKKFVVDGVDGRCKVLEYYK